MLNISGPRCVFPPTAASAQDGRTLLVSWDWSAVTGAGGFVRSFAVNAYTANGSWLANSTQLALDSSVFQVNSSLSGKVTRTSRAMQTLVN